MFNNLPQQLYSAIIENDRWKMYLEGFGNTLILALGAIVIGLVLGALVAIVKVNFSGKKKKGIILRIINFICDVYLTVIRGTPVMVQVIIAYAIIFASWGNELSIPVGIIAFGINSGAYVAEIIRAGILAVDRGQSEAGRSLGLTYGMTMRQIVMPQAIKNILPALGNELIVLVKETAIVGYIAVQDLTKMAMLIQSRTFQPLVPLLLAALIYLLLVMLMSWGLRKFERRLARSDYR